MVQASPGVVLLEQDFSDVAAQFSSAILGIVGTANKGPFNQLVTVTSVQQLLDTFGVPVVTDPAVTGHADPEDPNSGPSTDLTKFAYMRGFVGPAMRFLRQGNICRCVRVAASTPASSSLNLSDGGSTTVTVEGVTPGTWGNDIQVTVATAPSGGNYFNLLVYYKGALVETFSDLLQDAANSADADYVNTRINGTSFYVTAVNDAGSSTRPVNVVESSLAGGTDNDTGMVAGDFIGVVNGSPPLIKTGLQIFRDSDFVDINMLACPGVSVQVNATVLTHTKDVAAELEAVARARGDTIALLDTLHTDDTPALSKTYANAAASFNSSYSALYWPYIRHYESNAARNDGSNAGVRASQVVWESPVGFVAGQMAFTDAVADPWFAAAGLNRGIIRKALGILYNTNLGEREDIYGPSQVVNPIVKFQPEGIAVYGNKTTQRKISALSNVHVRRMLNVAKKVIGTAVKFLVFEPNDPQTYRRFRQLVKPVLSAIAARRGLQGPEGVGFQVLCDEATNPPALIDQNRMRGILLLKPTRAAEVIEVNFTILSTGTSFDEFQG